MLSIEKTAIMSGWSLILNEETGGGFNLRPGKSAALTGDIYLRDEE